MKKRKYPKVCFISDLAAPVVYIRKKRTIIIKLCFRICICRAEPPSLTPPISEKTLSSVGTVSRDFAHFFSGLLAYARLQIMDGGGAHLFIIVWTLVQSCVKMPSLSFSRLTSLSISKHWHWKSWRNILHEFGSSITRSFMNSLMWMEPDSPVSSTTTPL